VIHFMRTFLAAWVQKRESGHLLEPNSINFVSTPVAAPISVSVVFAPGRRDIFVSIMGWRRVKSSMERPLAAHEDFTSLRPGAWSVECHV
jgi:hypothetical protein